VLESVKQGRSAYLLRRSRHAVSTASRSFVSHRASRAPHGRFRGAITGPTCRSSRSLVRPSRAHAGGSTPTSRSDGTLLGFDPLQRMKNRGSGHRGLATARHLPSPAFRTPSTVYSPRLRPGLFHPGNAPGVPVFRALLRPVVRASLEAEALLPFRSPQLAAKRGGRPATPERCSHRSVQTVPGRNPRTADALLTSVPLRLSLPPG